MHVFLFNIYPITAPVNIIDPFNRNRRNRNRVVEPFRERSVVVLTYIRPLGRFARRSCYYILVTYFLFNAEFEVQ